MRRCLRHSSRLADLLHSLYVEPKRKREYPRRNYVSLSLTCLNSTDPEDDAIPLEPTLDHNARAQGPQLLAVPSSLVLATRTCES
jgi:hypothetical protein